MRKYKNRWQQQAYNIGFDRAEQEYRNIQSTNYLVGSSLLKTAIKDSKKMSRVRSGFSSKFSLMQVGRRDKLIELAKRDSPLSLAKKRR